MSLVGELKDLSLAELIEFFCNQKKTGRLKVYYSKATGIFDIRSGELIDARLGSTKLRELLVLLYSFIKRVKVLDYINSLKGKRPLLIALATGAGLGFATALLAFSLLLGDERDPILPGVPAPAISSQSVEASTEQSISKRSRGQPNITASPAITPRRSATPAKALTEASTPRLPVKDDQPTKKATPPVRETIMVNVLIDETGRVIESHIKESGRVSPDREATAIRMARRRMYVGLSGWQTVPVDIE
jgi:hypothetical protein